MNQTEMRQRGWSVPTETKFLESADGTSIYATRRGEGEIAVLVVHGFSGGHRNGSHARILGWFEKQGFAVFAIDQRGHGTSGGECTLAHYEPLDIDAGVRWARECGAKQVFVVGFSMGSASVLRHAALSNPATQRPESDLDLILTQRPDGVVSVGGAGTWFYRGSWNMRVLHLLVSTTWGMWYVRNKLQVRLRLDSWPAEKAPNRHAIQPLDPPGCMAALAPTPALVVHGEHDDFFPVEHAQRLHEAGSAAPGSRASLWVRQGMAHAEQATTAELVADIANWIRTEAEVNARG